MPRSQKPLHSDGFAIIATLGLVSLLVLVALTFTVQMRVEQFQASSLLKREEARMAAYLALMQALGELQATAGPDQRVTATASLIDEASPDQHALGVWKTDSWNDLQPRENRELAGWLISTADPGTGRYRRNTNEEPPDLETSPAPDVILLDPGGNRPKVKAELVSADSSSDLRYAFWVGDEGVKARINLPPPERDEPISLEEQRFFQAPANADPGILFPSLSQPELQDLPRLASWPAFQLVAPDADIEGEAVFDYTLHSFGLLTNPIDGGLKRDLTTLFEQDDEDFAAGRYGTDAPENLRVDETGDEVSSPTSHRLLYVEDSLPHTGRAGHTLRGPSWSILRDYYRLYRGIEAQESGEFASVKARPLLPRPVSPAREMSFKASHDHDNPPVMNQSLDAMTRFPPRSSKLAPTLLRFQFILSLQAVPYSGPTYHLAAPGGPRATHFLRLIFSPVIVIWNPYDIELKFQGMAFNQTNSLPLTFDWEVETPNHGIETSTRQALSYLAGLGGNPWHGGPTYAYASPGGITLAPGETRVLALSDPSLQGFGGPGKRFELEAFDTDQGGLFLNSAQKQRGISTVIEYYNEAGEAVEVEQILLNEDSGVAFRQVWNLENIGDLWNSTFFLIGGLVHEGFYEERFNVKPWDNGDAVSFVSVSAMNTAFGNSSGVPMFESIGRWGRIPETDGGTPSFLRVGDHLLDRLPVGMITVYARAADAELPSKIFGPHNPAPVVTTSPYFHNEFGEENMLPPFHIEAERTDQLTLLEFDPFSRKAFWGASYQSSTGSHHIPAFHVPRLPTTSLAALQHAQISYFAFEPSHAIGNAFASPWIAQDSFWREMRSPNNPNQPRRQLVGDLSYLANRALWDDYFFSAIAPREGPAFEDLQTLDEIVDDTATPLSLNPRMTPLTSREDIRNVLLENGELRTEAYREISGHLAVEGMFNVNSTSSVAWASLLRSLREEALAYFAAETGALAGVHEPDDATPFPRSLTAAGPLNALWSGFRQLSDSEVEMLADEIVEQVRERGPFMSLGHFVNRELADSPQGLSGTLQAAIDAAAINEGPDFFSQAVPSSATVDIPNPAAAQGPTSVGAPAYLTQADILQTLGPVISVRSDTFRIRAYGETDESKVWLEAIVQRLPAYVDPSDPPSAGPGDLTAVNQSFGRRFRIVSMKWLSSPEEL